MRFTRELARNPCEASLRESHNMPLLMDEMEDFTRNHPDDRIFEEHDTPALPDTPFDWKSGRPCLLKSAANSAWVVLQLMTAGGLVMGTIGVICFYIDINTIHYCHWVPQGLLKRIRRSERVVGSAFQAFLIEFWQFLTLWTIFKWPMLKKLNLLTITMLVAFGDFSYRLFLHIFDAFKSPWIPYPMNVLFAFLVVYSSYAVGREVFPYRKSEALVLGFKLCVQFLLTIPVTFFFTNAAFWWFVQNPAHEFKRLLIAAFAPMIMLPGKAIARLCACHLDGVNHPGTSYAVVAVSYGASSIVFRTLQAGMESYKLFLALSIGHGVVYVSERLTVQLRDYYWEKLGVLCCGYCCYSCSGGRRQTDVRNPRRQRLTADMSIQGMLFESTVIVCAVGVRLLYGSVYGTSPTKWLTFRVELIRRVLVALVIEWVFGSIILLVQTHYMNIPVKRVWRRNWRKHLLVTFITTVMIGLFFTEYLLVFIRAEYEADNTISLTENCTKPFY